MKYFTALTIGIMLTMSCSNKVIHSDPSTLTQVLELKKTACFGSCPVFTFKVYNNRLAILDGKDNLEHIGLSRRVLSKEEMKSLMSSCDEAQLFSLKDDYHEKVMDLPTTTLTYFKEGQKKVISGNMNFPKGFEKVVVDCMTIVKAEGWILQEAYNTK